MRELSFEGAEVVLCVRECRGEVGGTKENSTGYESQWCCVWGWGTGHGGHQDMWMTHKAIHFTEGQLEVVWASIKH